jgi:DNA (cytosine-5)-methyltransferase 1
MTRKSKVPKLRAVSLFSGAGGLDYGFEAAGFDTVAAVEFDRDSCSTLRTNRPGWAVIERDIQAVPSRELLDAAGVRAGEVELVIGGPPCQPFSKSAYWAHGDTKRLEDSRAVTLSEYMRVVEELLPAAFVLENVHGIAYSGKEEGFNLLNRLTRDINHRHGTNYTLSWQVLNAADYGVPQLRRRFFIVGHREGLTLHFPAPTHAEHPATAGATLFELPALLPYATAWDAIGGVDPRADGEDLRVRGRWAELLPSIPEGDNYSWHTERKGGMPLFGWRRAYWCFLLKLAKALPSWTLQAQPGPAIGPFHWENRRLAVVEMARLQTFPQGIRFVGNRGSVQKQLGNAVPSLLAEVIGREVAEQFFGAQPTIRPQLAIAPRRPIPDPEPVQPVPEKFHHLEGKHEPHPGTGKGYAASRRNRSEEKLEPALPVKRLRQIKSTGSA